MRKFDNCLAIPINYGAAKGEKLTASKSGFL